jgi:hypothetical protein
MPRRLALLIALYVTAVPVMYACGDDTTRPGASGDDTSSSSGGADSALHDVGTDTARDHAGDGPPGDGAGDGAQTPDSGEDEASEEDVAVFEAATPRDEGVGSADSVLPTPDGPHMIGD